MQIEDLAPEQPITLLVVAGDQQLEFSSTILEVLSRKHTVLATPVTKDDKVIAFNGKGILIHLIVTFPDEKPHIFQNVTIRTVKRKDDSLCYTITTIAESKVYNRRGAFRCYIGIDTHVRIGANRGAVDAILKDISMTGFSFTTSCEKEYAENDMVHAVINDYIEETCHSYSFHLFGTIVRHYPLENGYMVYGCKFNTKVSGLERYIMEKERIRLQKSHGGAKTPPKAQKD